MAKSLFFYNSNQYIYKQRQKCVRYFSRFFFHISQSTGQKISVVSILKLFHRLALSSGVKYPGVKISSNFVQWFGQNLGLKIRILNFLAYLVLFSYLKFGGFMWNETSAYNLKINAKFEFWRVFDPRLWPYSWLKFDEIWTIILVVMTCENKFPLIPV